MSWYWKIIVLAALLIAGGAAQFLLTERDVPTSDSIVESGVEVAVPEPSIVDPTGGGYDVRILPIPETKTPVLKAPNVEKLIAEIVPKNDYEKIVHGNLASAAATLKAEPDDYDAWLTVGISLKQLERFTDARDSFLYIFSLWPTQAVPQGNLGSLYHLYLKDFPKSEAAYKKAIELDPTQASWRRGLYDLYRYSYKQNTNAGEDALTAGIEATGALDLMAALAERYTGLKRFAEAVALYDRAIAAAEKQEESEALVDRLVALRAAARAEMQ